MGLASSLNYHFVLCGETFGHLCVSQSEENSQIRRHFSPILYFFDPVRFFRISPEGNVRSKAELSTSFSNLTIFFFHLIGAIRTNLSQNNCLFSRPIEDFQSGRDCIVITVTIFFFCSTFYKVNMSPFVSQQNN